MHCTWIRSRIRCPMMINLIKGVSTPLTCRCSSSAMMDGFILRQGGLMAWIAIIKVPWSSHIIPIWCSLCMILDVELLIFVFWYPPGGCSKSGYLLAPVLPAPYLFEFQIGHEGKATMDSNLQWSMEDFRFLNWSRLSFESPFRFMLPHSHKFMDASVPSWMPQRRDNPWQVRPYSLQQHRLESSSMRFLITNSKAALLGQRLEEPSRSKSNLEWRLSQLDM